MGSMFSINAGIAWHTPPPSPQAYLDAIAAVEAAQLDLDMEVHTDGHVRMWLRTEVARQEVFHTLVARQINFHSGRCGVDGTGDDLDADLYPGGWAIVSSLPKDHAERRFNGRPTDGDDPHGEATFDGYSLEEMYPGYLQGADTICIPDEVLALDVGESADGGSGFCTLTRVK